MRKKLLVASILLNVSLLFMFGFKTTKTPDKKSIDCPCADYNKIYENGGYYIYKNEQYDSIKSNKDFDLQRSITRSRIIDFKTATKMIRHLPNVRNIYVTNYIDFDYEHIFKVLVAQADHQIPPAQMGIRVYYGAYNNETLNSKHPKNERHYSAIVVGTNEGVDLYNPDDINEFPIVNYGNLCPPVCSGDDNTGDIFFPNPAKAKLYFDSGLSDTTSRIRKKFRKSSVKQK
jgi:hypothetical protein